MSVISKVVFSRSDNIITVRYDGQYRYMFHSDCETVALELTEGIDPSYGIKIKRKSGGVSTGIVWLD